MQSLLTLAQQHAARHGTKILSHRIDGDQITFILESGPKLTKTAAELTSQPSTPDPSPVTINPSDGIDQTEASAAGSALAKRRRPREQRGRQRSPGHPAGVAPASWRGMENKS